MEKILIVSEVYKDFFKREMLKVAVNSVKDIKDVIHNNKIGDGLDYTKEITKAYNDFGFFVIPNCGGSETGPHSYIFEIFSKGYLIARVKMKYLKELEAIKRL